MKNYEYMTKDEKTKFLDDTERGLKLLLNRIENMRKSLPLDDNKVSNMSLPELLEIIDKRIERIRVPDNQMCEIRRRIETPRSPRCCDK